MFATLLDTHISSREWSDLRSLNHTELRGLCILLGLRQEGQPHELRERLRSAHQVARQINDLSQRRQWEGGKLTIIIEALEQCNKLTFQPTAYQRTSKREVIHALEQWLATREAFRQNPDWRRKACETAQSVTQLTMF